MQPQAENSVFVEFYTDAVEMGFESEKEGRPIFKDMAHVRILIPGDKNNIIERRASKEDEQKYPNAWKRFQASEATGHTGTPLEQWPQISRSQVKEAKYFEIHTVEQMAELTDANTARLGMGFSDLRTKAKAYLGAAADTAKATAQAAENSRLRSEMADLQAQVKELAAVKSNEAVRGRPRKELVEA